MTTSLLRITDGTTTLNFSSGSNMKLITYNARTSESGERVTENVRVDFTGSAATNTTTMRSINKLFEQARNYERSETGSRVYVEYDPGSSGTYWRSRLYDGKIISPDNLLGPWMYDTRWLMTIEITRQPFWEGALTAVPLTNSSATDDTAGITVNNATDATNSLENFVDIDGVNDLTGDLPAPIKIEMYNSYVSAEPADEIYIHHNIHSTPATLTHILEGEDATGATVTSTAEGAIPCSEDLYGALAWTATTETKVATWAISSAQLTAAAGGRFTIITRWRDAFPYTNCWLRFTLETSAGTIHSGNLVLVPDTRELHEIDTMFIPPYGANLADLAGVNLCMYALRNQSGTHTINLDYLQLSPISSIRGWKHFYGTDAATGTDYQEYFYHDAIEGYDYSVDASGDKRFEFTPYGGPIELVPGENQRLYFLSCDKTNGDALVSQTWTVKLWYRPRRNAL